MYAGAEASFCAGAASGADWTELRGIGADATGRSTLAVAVGSGLCSAENGFAKGVPERRIESVLHAAAMLPIAPTIANRDTVRAKSLMRP